MNIHFLVDVKHYCIFNVNTHTFSIRDFETWPMSSLLYQLRVLFTLIFRCIPAAADPRYCNFISENKIADVGSAVKWLSGHVAKWSKTNALNKPLLNWKRYRDFQNARLYFGGCNKTRLGVIQKPYESVADFVIYLNGLKTGSTENKFIW